MKLKLINQKAFWWGVIAALIGVMLGRFIYYNVVVPWPYREELRACLDEAKTLEVELAVDEARNVCFRTYPHFL